MTRVVLGVAVVLILAVLAFLLWTPDLDRATLEQRYLRRSADVLQVNGVQLHVRDDGPADAPAVILLHGFGASLHTWEPWAQALSADHRVIRFDLPGSGLSPPDPTGQYTDDRSMQLLLALMDQLQLQRASLVGHSIGGRLAWRLAAEHPARVDRLVLLAPDGFASNGFEYGKTPEVPASFKLMRQVLPRPVLHLSLVGAYADPAALTAEMERRYFDLIRAPGSRDALLARMAQTRLVDPVPLLRRIQAPTLLVWGEQDRAIPISNAADYMAAVPTIQLLSLPDMGHLPHEETPGRALPAVRAFLK